jgi:hypothetical protein
MPRIRSVVVWTVAALVTAGMEIVGLHRAIALRSQLDTESGAPAPVAVPETSAVLETGEVPTPAPLIRLLSVRDDAVEIEVNGRHHELPGYPPPRSTDHRPARLTTAVVAPDGGLVAIAGECSGASGVSEPRAPSCVPVFVRLYRVADGSHVRDLKMRWRHADNDERRPLAMAFDERAERLAVLVLASWSDCSWSGHFLDLVVYRLADGARIARRVLTTEYPDGTSSSLRFHDDEVHVLTTRAHARPKTRVVQLRKPGAA